MTLETEAELPALNVLVRDLRTRKGLALRDVAIQVGVDPSYISKLESGQIRMPSEKVLARLAEVLGISIEDLMRAGGYIRGDTGEVRKPPNTRRKNELPRAPRIGERIRSMRRAQDMTQKELADKLDVNVQTLGNWEAGVTPRSRYIYRLAEILGTTPDVLLGRARPSVELKDPEVVRFVKEVEKELETFPPRARVHLMTLIRHTIQAARALHDVEHNALVQQSTVESQSTVSPDRQDLEHKPRESSTLESESSFKDLEMSSTLQDSQELLERVHDSTSEGARHLAAIELDQNER